MKIEQLPFTRFIAAILVVCFHFGRETALFYEHPFQFLFNRGNIAVSYFFVLSGFVMLIAYFQKPKLDLLSYFSARFARIYPLYLLSIILVASLSFFCGTADKLGLILNIFMIQAWIPGMATSFNLPAWSLCIELLFYIIFPFLLLHLYKKIDYKKLLTPAVLFWMLSLIISGILFKNRNLHLLPFVPTDFLYFPILHLNEFLLGNIAALWFLNQAPKQKNYDIAIVLTIILLIVVLKIPTGPLYHNGLWAPLFVVLILLLSSNNGYISRLFKHRFLVFLGEISYGIYILQYAVWEWLKFLRVDQLFNLQVANSANITFALRLTILITVAAFSYLLIESPIRNQVKKHIQNLVKNQ